MDAAELARWTRFAAKGGIGKCSATRDCVAESSEDLMFLKDDEIIVLMQLSDHQNLFLGYCEGVVGRFEGSDVHFLSRLKKPIMTKRSSVSSSSHSPPINVLAKSPTPTFDLNTSPSPRHQAGSPVPVRRRTLTGSVPRMSIDAQTIGASVPQKDKEQQKLGVNTDMEDVHSSPLSPSSAPTASTLVSSSPAWSGVTLVSGPGSMYDHHPAGNHTLYTSIPISLPATTRSSYSTPPTVVLPKSPPLDTPRLPLLQTTSTSTYANSTAISTASTSSSPSSSALPSSSPATTASPSTADTPFDTARMSFAYSESDGAVGIGLSLLHDLANGSGYSDDDADSDESSGSHAQRRDMGVLGRESVSESPSWMRNRTSSPDGESHSGYSQSDEGDSMHTAGPDAIVGLEGDEGLRYEDDDTEPSHVVDHEREYDRGVDQEYSDEEYEEDEETTEGFDLNLELNLLTSSPSSVSTHPKSHLDHRPSPLRSSSSSSSSPQPSTSPQHLTFPPVAPLSPQRYRGFRQQRFNFPAPPTHTPVPVSGVTPHAPVIIAAPARSVRTSTSTSGSSSSPRSPSFPPHLPPPGLASHPTSPLSASFPFPGLPSEDGEGRDRERRPSFASHLSNTTGTAGSDWDGAGDIYDDYRYSRSSMSVGTGRTTSIASVSVAHTPGRNRSGSGSRRVSGGSRRTSVGSSMKRASVGVGSSKTSVGEVEMPPPFVDNPEARMRADSEAQRTASMSRSNTTTSMASRHEPLPIVARSLSPDAKMFVRGVHIVDEDLERTLWEHDQDRVTNGSDEDELIPRDSQMESLASEDDDDASIYTQSSIGRESVASVSRAQQSYTPSTSGPALVPARALNLTSTIPTSTSTPAPAPAPAPSIFTSPRPAPLALAVPNGKSTTGPSPLLHTTWGSPSSSTSTATPDTGSGIGKGGYTPLFAGGLDALSRALAAGVAAVVGVKAGGSSGEDEGGAAIALRQQNVVESTLSSAPLISKPILNAITDEELQSREEGLGQGRGVIIEDENENLVLSPSSPMSLRAVGESVGDGDSMFGMVIRESPEPEPAILVMGRSAPLVIANRTPSPTETSEGDKSIEEEGQDVETQEKGRSEGPSSSSMPPPQVLVMHSSDTAVQSSSDIVHPSLSSSPPPPPASSMPSPSPLPSSSLRPSLHELRGGQPGISQGQRRSLFLPHPNAPKAPSAHSPGPMYVTQQHSPPPLSQAQSGAVQTLKLALASRDSSGKPPTIYGRTHVDLTASVGPVLMIFSVDPPPPTPPPMRMLSPSPSSLSSNGRGSLVPPEPGSVSTGGSEQSESVEPQQRGSGVIPRANFFPKAGGARPRSRSFSGFNAESTEVPLPIQWSNEEGGQILEIPSASEVRRSLSSTGSLSPSIPPSSGKTSSLRVSSPLSQHSTVGFSGLQAAKTPGSPLAQTITISSSPTTAPNRPVHQLRRNVSKADISDPSPPRPHPTTRTILSSETIGGESAPTSPVVPPSQGRDFTPETSSARGRPSRDTDTASMHSTRSNVISPTPVARQSSLRSKLSLPNLRRNLSRQDDTSITGSAGQPSDTDTMQVKDMDFELVRPNLSHLQPQRTSEDSSLVGRDGLGDFKHPSSLHTDSPAVSTSSPRSPTVSDGPSPTAPSHLPAAPTNIQPKPSESESSMDAHRQREQKWMSVLSTVPPSQSKKSKKVKKLLLEGVPSSVRYLVWTHLTDGKARSVPGVYAQLGARGRVPAFVNIEKDVQRCFNDHPHLQSMQGSILSLLQAYLTMVPDVQYSTGLTLIAGQLLLLAPEEDAFWIFISIMDTHLRPYFSSTHQIDVDSALFSRALESSDSVVAKKILNDMSISPIAICRPWFTSLFVGSLPLEHLNRVWDIFLLEGVPFLLRIGIALVSACRRQILDAPSEATVLRLLCNPHLSLLPPSADTFISLAFSVKLKDDDIRKQRVKMEAEVKRQTQTPRLVSTSTSISLPRN